MLTEGDLVYIRETATPKELDYNSYIQPGDGPFTIGKVDDTNVGWVKLREVSWWVQIQAVTLHKPCGENKILRKIALMEKRWKERYK